MTQIHGEVAEGFGAVGDAFADNFDDRGAEGARLGSKEMRQGVSCLFTRTYILGLWCRSPRLREEWQNETVRDTF